MQSEFGIVNALMAIAKTADEKLEQAKTKEEKAFFLGYVCLTASLVTAIRNSHNGIVTCAVNFDYKSALKDYEDACKEYEEEQENKQMSMEEMFPDLFSLIKDAVKETMQEQSKKPKKE